MLRWLENWSGETPVLGDPGVSVILHMTKAWLYKERERGIGVCGGRGGVEGVRAPQQAAQRRGVKPPPYGHTWDIIDQEYWGTINITYWSLAEWWTCMPPNRSGSYGLEKTRSVQFRAQRTHYIIRKLIFSSGFWLNSLDLTSNGTDP